MASTNTWVPGERKGSGDIVHQIGSFGGTPIGVDASDPNTVAPLRERVFMTPKVTKSDSAGGKQSLVFAVGDKGCTLQLWWYSSKIGRWFKFLGTIAITADSMTANGPGLQNNSATAPEDVPMTVQVTANAGSATVIGIGFG